MPCLAFDVFGTLIDTHGMLDLLRRYVGDEKALPFAVLWRDKQLEYAFRRSMMNRYEPFDVCTGDALAYCIDALNVSLTQAQHSALIERYQQLPVYPDVAECLHALRERGDMQVYALTNGPQQQVARLFERAAIDRYFEDIVSVDEIGRYKPDPAVYRHFLDRTGAGGSDSWLISSNTFDVIGAGAAGMNSIWVRRTEQQRMDPWGDRPTHTIRTLLELGTLF